MLFDMWPLSLFKRKTKIPPTPAEVTLDQIKNILFPPMTVDKDEKEQIFMIDWAIDSNVLSAFSDVNSGYTDPAVQNSLLLSAERLVKVRDLLGVTTEMHPDAVYFAISHPQDVQNGVVQTP